jgi:hypothetical protein
MKGARGIPRGFVVMVLADDETSLFDIDADDDAAAEDMVQAQVLAPITPKYSYRWRVDNGSRDATWRIVSEFQIYLLHGRTVHNKASICSLAPQGIGPFSNRI